MTPVYGCLLEKLTHFAACYTLRITILPRVLQDFPEIIIFIHNHYYHDWLKLRQHNRPTLNSYLPSPSTTRCWLSLAESLDLQRVMSIKHEQTWRGNLKNPNKLYVAFIEGIWSQMKHIANVRAAFLEQKMKYIGFENWCKVMFMMKNQKIFFFWSSSSYGGKGIISLPTAGDVIRLHEDY